MRRTGVVIVTAATIVVSAAAGPAQASTPDVTTLLGAYSVYDHMSMAQRIGQLFMVGGAATGVSDATRTAISRYHVGNVILTGRSSNGVAATRSVTDGLQDDATSAATASVPLLVATDQEGGEVQVLSGSGFSSIPSGVTQGTWDVSTLQASARTWGGQLAAAGVNLDLAPVLDTVPVGRDNPPIGGYDREYGHTPSVVAAHGNAFALGMSAAGVLTSIKHFPGLGRVTANTDTSSGVTDDETTSTDAYLEPFKTAIGSGAPLVMMSTAYYSRIDAAHPAAFSPTIVTGLLRNQLRFRGLVISDDLGNAQQVAAWTPGERAVDFIAAGGDIVLDVNADLIAAMVSAVATKASSDSGFRAQVDAAALRVLLMKQARGLIRAPASGDFTADGHSDAATYRPSDHQWRVLGGSTTAYGEGADLPAAADYTGSGRAHIAVFRPSTGYWYLRGLRYLHYGQAGDVPVPGDYRGTGLADVAVFRPKTGTWFRPGLAPVQWGSTGDIPVPADWSGNGIDDVAVFRPSNGTWYRYGLTPFVYGRRGDIPVPGDYTGDGVTDAAVFRPTTGDWLIRGVGPIHFGQAGDVPLPGFDFNGDGVADIAVWRPSTGTWFVRGQAQRSLGLRGDVPV